jgi:hypothetical protein
VSGRVALVSADCQRANGEAHQALFDVSCYGDDVEVSFQHPNHLCAVVTIRCPGFHLSRLLGELPALGTGNEFLFPLNRWHPSRFLSRQGIFAVALPAGGGVRKARRGGYAPLNSKRPRSRSDASWETCFTPIGSKFHSAMTGGDWFRASKQNKSPTPLGGRVRVHITTRECRSIAFRPNKTR